ILGDLLVSIDQQNHLIRFQKTGKVAVAANDNKPRRLGVQFRGFPSGSVLTIGRVDPDSLGEQAGLLPGDVLLTLNDKPTEQYGMSDLRALFGGSEPLTFEIERDGEAKTVEIK
ncbi:MAG: PDZ domain-containing protein, partial [Pseudomonadales bacterium]